MVLLFIVATYKMLLFNHVFYTQGKHMSMLKIGRKHKFSLKVNSEQHDTWLITALQEYFYLRVDVDIRTWGVVIYVAYIGPKCNAKNFTYEVTDLFLLVCNYLKRI